MCVNVNIINVPRVLQVIALSVFPALSRFRAPLRLHTTEVSTTLAIARAE